MGWIFLDMLCESIGTGGRGLRAFARRLQRDPVRDAPHKNPAVARGEQREVGGGGA